MQPFPDRRFPLPDQKGMHVVFPRDLRRRFDAD